MSKSRSYHLLWVSLCRLPEKRENREETATSGEETEIERRMDKDYHSKETEEILKCSISPLAASTEDL